MTRWIWVSLPHATFALVVTDGTVTDAAPIARWAVGKDEGSVARHFRQRGAQFRAIPETGTQATVTGPER